MASTAVRPIAGTDGALHPFFSPDGQWVGFLTDNQVKKVPVQGGSPKTLCDALTPVQAWPAENAAHACPGFSLVAVTSIAIPSYGVEP